MKTVFATMMTFLAMQAHAAMPTTYILTVTNGSAMPLSPALVYTVNGESSKAQVGMAPTPGLVKLCQTGDPSLRAQEFGMLMDITFKTQTMGLILPGESRTLEVEVQDPLQQSIQFETMYGKTKDSCAVGTISSHALYALKQHVTSEYIGKDNALQTGAFLDPALPEGHNYLDMNICSAQADAVSCLRSLSQPNMGMQKVHFFSPYLSSVTMLLENQYGAAQTQTLIIPPSGAVEIRLKLKH